MALDVKDFSTSLAKTLWTIVTGASTHVQGVELIDTVGTVGTQAAVGLKLGALTETPAATPTTSSGLNGLLRALIKILEGGAENFKAVVTTASQNEQLITSTDNCALNSVSGFNAQDYNLVIGIYDGNAAPVAPGTPITWIIAPSGLPFYRPFGALRKFPNGMGVAIVKAIASGTALDGTIADQTTVEVRYTP